MHKFSIPETMKATSAARRGAAHPLGRLDGPRTAFVVIDMQNYFMAPGEQGEVPMAREIVPSVNRLAKAVRAAQGHVVWVQNSTVDTRRLWSVLHDRLMTPMRRERRWASMDESGQGFPLWSALDVQPGDGRIIKKRYSAMIQGSSSLEGYLRERGVDTILIGGTATNVCCESTARDAMMLNFGVAMISDANATYTDEIHAASLLNFYTHFGDVLTVDEAVAGLASHSETRARIA